MAEIKRTQSDWLSAFWPVSHEPNFSQIYDLYRNTANTRNFHYRTNSEKNNVNFLKFSGEKNFPKKNLLLPCATK